MPIMSFSQHLKVIVFLILSSSLSGCSSNEPDDQFIQRSFLKHSEDFEYLLKIFQEDIADYQVTFVSAVSPNRTQCELRPQRHSCSLRTGRWEEYQRRLQQLGVLWIEHDGPGDIYFVTFYESFLMDARIRGVVFSTTESSQVSRYSKKQEWENIQGGWYSFLVIDN